MDVLCQNASSDGEVKKIEPRSKNYRDPYTSQQRYEYSLLANVVYKGNDKSPGETSEFTERYKQEKHLKDLGWDRIAEEHCPGSSLDICLYRNKNTNQYAVVFRGTDPDQTNLNPFNGKKVVVSKDITQADRKVGARRAGEVIAKGSSFTPSGYLAGKALANVATVPTEQLIDASNIIERWNKEHKLFYSKHNTIAIGHSLGGAEAAISYIARPDIFKGGAHTVNSADYKDLKIETKKINSYPQYVRNFFYGYKNNSKNTYITDKIYNIHGAGGISMTSDPQNKLGYCSFNISSQHSASHTAKMQLLQDILKKATKDTGLDINIIRKIKGDESELYENIMKQFADKLNIGQKNSLERDTEILQAVEDGRLKLTHLEFKNGKIKDDCIVVVNRQNLELENNNNFTM